MPAFYTLDTLYKMQHVSPYNLHTLVSWLLYLGIRLCEWLSPQIRHFGFDLQFFAEWPKLWQLKHCVTETGFRNSSTLYTMPVTLQIRFCERRASALWGSLISSRKIGRTLSSFLLFKRSALAKLILLRLRNSRNSSSVILISVGTPFIARLLFWVLLIW